MANACLFSGGKDSVLALHKAFWLGVRVDLLITMAPKSRDSYMFHYPNIGFTKLQAEALGIRQVLVETEGAKEEELYDLEEALAKNNVATIVTGAIASRYQADRINKIASKLGIEHIAPLWHMDQMEELKEVAKNFEAIITSVSAEGLDESFLGRKIDDAVVGRIGEISRKYGINPAFEGGEAETFVLNAPLFRKGIKIKKAHIEWHSETGIYFIDDAGFDG